MSTASRPVGQEDPRKKYALNVEDIKDDLTPGRGRPEWIFSAYGPGRHAPVQLFGGQERERSFEEMRAVHYAATAAGNPQTAIQDANDLYTAAEAQIQTILNDLEGAIKYVIDGANHHPNRIDITEGKLAASTGQQGAFGAGVTTSQTPAFSQPGSLSQPTPGALSFGQPSGLGQQGQPAFNKPAFGQPSFGQPSGLGSTGGLGGMQPSFGQPSTLNASPFSQPLSQAPVQPNPFNQTSSASPFTQLTNQSQITGQPQIQAQGPSPFEKSAATGAFAQPQAAHNPFGQPFPSTAPAAPLFSTQPQASTPFAQPTPSGTNALATQPAFGIAAVPGVATATAQTSVKDMSKLNPFPKISGETRRDPTTKRLTLWKGQPVKYVDNEPCFQHPDASEMFVHIYFPDGPPAPGSFKSSVGNPEQYTPEIETAYRYLKEHGAFKDGVMPFVPPRPEWCSFDL